MRGFAIREAALAAVLAAGCGGGETPSAGTTAGGDTASGAKAGQEPWLQEAAAQHGLVFQHVSGHSGRHLFPEIMCGGAALFDMEGDGDLDAYLVQAGGLAVPQEERPGNQLFENGGAGMFTDISAESGADDRGYGMGVAAGDVDNDGLTDLYVTNVDENRLLRNEGAGRFADVTAAARVGDPTWSASAAFLDHDDDGDLDLFVANYILWSIENELTCFTKPHPEDYCSPLSYDAPAPDTLYRNEGNGTFTDVSAEAGLRKRFGNGLGVVCSDFDGDGREDIFVANDGMMNQLWANLGGGRFEEAAVARGCAVDQDGRQKAGMGVGLVDVDEDGDEDLLVVNLAGEPDSFFRNDGKRFIDRTSVMGLSVASRPFTRFGAGFVDFDNDGYLDLYQANGRVTRDPEYFGERPFDESNLLFRGSASGRFEEVLPKGGTWPSLVATSRAAAFGDVDGDGGIDVLVVNRDGPAYLLLDRVSERGNWVAFRVLDEHGRDALGATVSATVGGRRLVRRVRSAYSYCSANDARVHLGLGQETLVRDVVVTWVDGKEQSFGDLDAGRVAELRRGD